MIEAGTPFDNYELLDFMPLSELEILHAKWQTCTEHGEEWQVERNNLRNQFLHLDHLIGEEYIISGKCSRWESNMKNVDRGGKELWYGKGMLSPVADRPPEEFNKERATLTGAYYNLNGDYVLALRPEAHTDARVVNLDELNSIVPAPEKPQLPTKPKEDQPTPKERLSKAGKFIKDAIFGKPAKDKIRL